MCSIRVGCIVAEQVFGRTVCLLLCIKRMYVDTEPLSSLRAFDNHGCRSKEAIFINRARIAAETLSIFSKWRTNWVT